MLNLLLISIGKSITILVQKLHLGSGSTWPGHIALAVNKRFIKDLLKNSPTKVIFVVGTNGKTTTTSLIRHLLEANGYSVTQNSAGANLLNGIASTLLLSSTLKGKVKSDVLLFEIDENAFPLALREIQPDLIVMLNLFRDQLDRYGEVATIAKKWKKAIETIPSKTTLILNADDPQIAFIGNDINNNVSYFSITRGTNNDLKREHASDSTFCPRCGQSLQYSYITYSHLGKWHCNNCSFTYPDITLNSSPFYPLSGTYNKYNTHAALLTVKLIGDDPEKTTRALSTFQPVFGRQEEVVFQNKKVKILLAKNPTGYNESLRTISALGAKNVLFILNDRVADGKDVSWIWDIDFEDFINGFTSITISGDRTYDMAMRIKYAQPIQQKKIIAQPNLNKAIKTALDKINKDETLYILPTYTAMLSLREILTGKKLL